MPNPFGTPMTRAWLTELEESSNFWNASDQLQLIAHIAAKESVSPWGLLAQIQRNHTALNSPEHRAPTMAMSGYVGMIDDGDNSARTIAVVAGDLCDVYSSGRGEDADAIIDSIAYSDDTDDDGYRLPRTVVHFLNHTAVFDGVGLPRLNHRDVTTLEMLWNGEDVHGVGRRREVTLPAGAYRVHGTWRLTPTTVAPMWKLLNSELPHLVLWAPSTEHRVGDNAPVRAKPRVGTTFPLPVWAKTGNNPYGVMGGALPSTYTPGDVLPEPVLVEITEPIREWLANRRDDLDVMLDNEPCCVPDSNVVTAHVATTRLVWKQSVAMAWMHGRCEPNKNDLDLALTQVKVSRATAAGAWEAVNGSDSQTAETVWKKLSFSPMSRAEITAWFDGDADTLDATLKLLGRENRASQDAAGFWWARRGNELVPAELAGFFKYPPSVSTAKYPENEQREGMS
ncbi:MAG: hypothetical protein E6R04_08490 [Spirochaetes bacterium]|nr:MAG: hypothetical protein E6R04_08490 [Spirochaetota bacterium]